MSPKIPRLYHDRTPVSELDDEVHEALRGLGLVQPGSAVVQFVGVIPTPETVFAFLPLGMEATVENMRVVMHLLARLERSSSMRGIDFSAVASSRVQTVSTALHLFEDYLAYGLYERSETIIRSSRAGKPLWPRTVAQKQPIWVDGDVPVYEQYIVRQSRRSEAHVLRQIQELVLGEIWESLGWWLGERVNALPRFTTRSQRSHPEEILGQLRVVQRVAYDERSLRLAELLIGYFSKAGVGDGRDLPIGTVLFEHAWEHILREVLRDVQLFEYGRVEYVPRAADARAVSYSLRPDIIAADTAERILILDAKYYSAQDASTLPGQSDIVKQLVYATEFQNRQLEKSRNALLRNCFVFPAFERGVGPWDRIRFANKLLYDPQVIECRYVSTEQVIRWYLSGERVDVSELLGT